MNQNVVRPHRNQVGGMPVSGLPYLNLPNESLWADISDYYAVVKSVYPKPWAYFHGALWRIRPVISTDILQIAQEVKVIARRGNILDVETIS